MSPGATSTLFLNTSGDGDSTTSLGSLFQHLNFFYSETGFCSLLLPVSFQHLRSSWVSFQMARVLWMTAGEERGRGWETAGFCSQHPRAIREGRHVGSGDGVRGLFLCFSGCHRSFRSLGGRSVHHQQQPFFWGGFGTSRALFFNSSSQSLSNLGEKEENLPGISPIFCITVLFVLTSISKGGSAWLKAAQGNLRTVGSAKNANLNQITDRIYFSQPSEKSAAS